MNDDWEKVHRAVIEGRAILLPRNLGEAIVLWMQEERRAGRECWSGDAMPLVSAG